LREQKLHQKGKKLIMRKFIDVFYGIEYSQLFPLCKKVGFDGFFSGEIYANHPNELEKIEQLAHAHDLLWETSHSTIPQSQTIWSDGEEGDAYCKILLANINNCKQFHVPLLVVHISPNFSKKPSFELGIQRLESVVEYAKKVGVKIAFENSIRRNICLTRWRILTICMSGFVMTADTKRVIRQT